MYIGLVEGTYTVQVLRLGATIENHMEKNIENERARGFCNG